MHHYCPPEHVAAEMDRLLELHHAHEGASPEMSAAWLHHRFTQIHPFQDGNGRVARALATLIFLRHGDFPLVVTRHDKPAYIGALRAADRGSLTELAHLFESIQKRALRSAISLSPDTCPTEIGREAILEGAAARRTHVASAKQQALSGVLDGLVATARTSMRKVEALIDKSIRPVYPSLRTDVYTSDESTRHEFTAQIVAVAKHFDYFANMTGPRRWVQLRIRDTFTTSLVVSLHHMGRVEAGVVAATAFVWMRESARTEQSESSAEQTILSEPACDEVFTITASRPSKDQDASFRAWLDRALAIGLEIWRRRL